MFEFQGIHFEMMNKKFITLSAFAIHSWKLGLNHNAKLMTARNVWILCKCHIGHDFCFPPIRKILRCPQSYLNTSKRHLDTKLQTSKKMIGSFSCSFIYFSLLLCASYFTFIYTSFQINAFRATAIDWLAVP